MVSAGDENRWINRRVASGSPRPASGRLFARRPVLLLALCCLLRGSAISGETVDGLVCTADSIPILRSEITASINKPRLTKEEWDKACSALIVQKLVEEIAKEEEIKVSDEEVEQHVMKALKDSGLEPGDVSEHLDRYRRQVRQYLIKMKVIAQKVRHKINVSAAEVKEYYERNKEEFHVAERRHIRMISALLDKTAEPEAARKAAGDKIEAVMKQIMEGKDFALLARRESNDPYAEKGGDWGWKEKGDLTEKLDEAAFSLEVGQVSDIIETRQGFHIIKVEERQPEYYRPFEEVQGKIQLDLIEARFQTEKARYEDSLVKNADIQYFDHGPEE